MIIIRYENAKPLSSIFKTQDDPYYFANTIMKAKEVNLIYYDEGIKYKKARKEIPAMFTLIGELERKNTPFILLKDKNCSVFNPTNNNLTIVNAKCLTQELLDSNFDSSTTIKDKNTLFHFLFQEFMDDNNDKVFKDAVEFFARAAAQDGLMKKESLLIAMSTKNGIIYNTSGSLGKAFNEGKVWFFNEEYDYDPEEIDKPKVEEPPARSLTLVERFCEKYEQYDCMRLKDILDFTEAEIEEIVRKYPTFFADLVLRGKSWCDKEGNAQCKFKYENDDDDDDVDDIADYYEEALRAPIGMRLCYSCQEFVPIQETEDINIGKDVVKLCSTCYPEMMEEKNKPKEKEPAKVQQPEEIKFQDVKYRMCHECHEYCSLLTATSVLSKGIRVWVCQQCYRAEKHAI